jgi:hypothetical protein
MVILSSFLPAERMIKGMAAQATPMVTDGARRDWRWGQVWTQAVFRPSVRTFEHILSDPKAQYSRAYLWVFTTVFLAMGAGVTFLFMEGNGTLAQQFGSVGAALAFGILPAALLFALLGGGAWVLLTEVWAAAVDALVGSAPEDGLSYDRLLYAFSAFLAPLVALSVLAALFASFRVPGLHVVQAGLCIYGLVLAVLATRAVYKASWVRCILCTLIGALPLALVLAMATMVLSTWAAAV